MFSRSRLTIGAFEPGFSTPADLHRAGDLRQRHRAAVRGSGATLCTLPFGSRINVGRSRSTRSSDRLQPPRPHPDRRGSTQLARPLQRPGRHGQLELRPESARTSARPRRRSSPSSASTTTTTIHDAAHNVVTAVAAGTTVHDFVTVSGGAGNPAPDRQRHDRLVHQRHLQRGRRRRPRRVARARRTARVDATGFAQGPLAAGLYGFRAHYAGRSGQPVYAPSDGACEPLRVVDANIQITPPTATNRVGQTHTFTAHVNVNDGSGGFVNAPDGTHDQLHHRLSGPGALVGRPVHHRRRHRQLHRRRSPRRRPASTTVSAHTTVTVGGVTLTRDDRRHRRQLRPGDEDLGQRHASRSRRARRTRSASRTRSRSRCRRTPAPARLRAGRRASTSTSR